MLARWGGRGVAVVVVAGLAAAALAVVLVAIAAARPLGFLHVRHNLSLTATLASANPDLAVSGPDAGWVVTVWTEEYTVGVGDRQGYVYLRAASESGGWGGKVVVFPGSGQACAESAAVAVSGTTAHVVYVVREDTCEAPSRTEVRYRTCSLTSGVCGGEELVASVDASQFRTSKADIALDAGGSPHVVWMRFEVQAGQARDADILYRTRTADGWGAQESVAQDRDNRNPAIAWADGYVHVVWEEIEEHRIWYRRRDGVGWEGAIPFCSTQTVRPPGNPDVAAGAGRVFVVWDWCSDPVTEPPCWKYNLVYRRSNDRGSASSWGSSSTREVGTDDVSFSLEYDSVDDPYEQDEYLLYLQPSVALNSEGWPVVAWHARRSEGDGGEDGGIEYYGIHYTYATTGGDSTVDWITPTAVLSHGQSSSLGSAVVAVGASDGEQPLFHFVYMQRPEVGTEAWDVYYDSNEEKSAYEYAYLPVVMRAY